MRNIIFILSSLLTLSSCSVYQEVWVVEKYPIEWEEDVIIKSGKSIINYKLIYGRKTKKQQVGSRKEYF